MTAAAQEDLTVVLLPDGPAGAALLDLARQWTAAGLLRPAAWTTTRAVDVTGSVPSVHGVHITGQEAEEVDVFSLLATRSRRVVRCVVVHLLPTASELDAAQAEAGHRLFERLGQQLPVRLDHTSGDARRLVRLSVLVPASGVEAVDPSVVLGGADAYVVVAPEDRYGPTHPADFVRPESNFPGHALAHVGVVGGLFHGVAEGALDERLTGASGAHALVLRANVRAVLGGSGTDVLADSVLESLMARTAPPPGMDGSYLVSRRPDELVGAVLDELLTVEDGALTYAPPPPSPRSIKPQTTWTAALASFGRFATAALAMFGRWVVLGVLRRAEGSITTMTYGRRGAGEVRLRPSTGADLARAARLELERSSRSAEQELRRAVEAGQWVAPPRVWSSLRGGVLGLLDGDLSPLAQRERAGRREVVLDPVDVVARPEDGYVPASDTARALELDAGDSTVPPWDPVLAGRLERHLEQARQEVAPDDGPARVEQVQPEPAEQSGADLPAEVAPEVGAGPAADVDAELDALRTWRDQRRPALTTRLAERLAGARAAAETDREAAESLLTDASSLAVDDVERARKRFLTATSCVVIVLLLAGASAYLARHHLAAQSWRTRAELGAGAGLTLLLAQVVLLHRYYQRHSALEWGLSQRLGQVRAAVTTAAHAAAEHRRLVALYDDLMAWIPLLAHVAHAAWEPPAPEPTPLPPTVEAATLPRSLGVSRAAGAGEDAGYRQRVSATAVLAQPGYLRRAYHQLVDRGLDHVDGGLHAKLECLDADSGGLPNGSRAALAHALRTGEPQRALALSARAGVERAAITRGAAAEGDDVLPLTAGDDARRSLRDCFADLAAPAPAFTPSLWSSEALVSGEQSNVRSVLWAPDWYEARPGPGGPVVRSVAVEEGPVVAAAIRCDYSELVPLSSLTLFAPSVRVPRVPEQDSGRVWV